MYLYAIMNAKEQEPAHGERRMSIVIAAAATECADGANHNIMSAKS